MFRNLAYNIGRITSYAIAGAAVALISAFLSQSEVQSILPIGQLFAATVMLALGLYFIGWTAPIHTLEKAGYHVWRRIEPFGRALFPARTPLHAFGLGLVWGWLPCGLVYSALALAVASGSPLRGAAIMLSFGLGTLPMLLAMGQTADALVRHVQKPAFRHAAGVLIIGLGLYTASIAINGQHSHPDHDHGAHSHLSMPHIGAPS